MGTARKDFGTIESDYEFFMSHSDEAEQSLILFFEQLDRIHLELLLDKFGRYASDGQIEIPTYCFHYEITRSKFTQNKS